MGYYYSVEKERRGQRISPVGPDEFRLPREVDPDEVVTIESLCNFIKGQRAAGKAAREKYPVPLPGQFVNKPNVRQQFGHVFVGAVLWMTSQLPQVPETRPLTPAEAVQRGHEIFSRIDAYRVGREGLLPPDIRYEPLSERNPHEPLELQVGRRVLELTRQHYGQAVGTASDALLALEIDAYGRMADEAQATLAEASVLAA